MSDQASASDTSGSTEFKAGRPPAIRVGGMRVGASRPRQTSQGDDKDKNFTNEDASGNSTTASGTDGTSDNDNRRNQEDTYDEQGSGQVQKAFPTEAVKQIHDKHGTHPKTEHHTHSKHDDQRFINQPRKQ
ncbi:unnamed protein product [Rotaria sp. Silwood2]|nr:unnamed protein product [Rotaria sp. Silwood2]CAF2870708.1 unnamed protein product [Rotaria sp. Silwood2]CAF3153341.1 unnamed protein product [Rotaria sp. Silwood2]CAF3322237.1 unnamed protein product [Rotaria sp. Silwood2]CAF3975591.1 unnamed protein product [Rotaria sp. Silwood2]